VTSRWRRRLAQEPDADGLGEARARLASYRADGVTQPWQPRGPMSRREVLSWVRNLHEPWTPA
jgi:hypothetical protein